MRNQKPESDCSIFPDIKWPILLILRIRRYSRLRQRSSGFSHGQIAIFKWYKERTQRWLGLLRSLKHCLILGLQVTEIYLFSLNQSSEENFLSAPINFLSDLYETPNCRFNAAFVSGGRGGHISRLWRLLPLTILWRMIKWCWWQTQWW